MFNPLPVRAGGLASRVVFSMHQFGRINRRMHNKLFIADNVFAVAGGRNIADEYFGRGGPANFIDMDILASGPVVAELSSVFDRFWNSEHAYPVQSLLGRDMDAAAARSAFEQRLPPAESGAVVAALDVPGHEGIESQLALGRIEQHFAQARVLADAATKIDERRQDGDDAEVMGGVLGLLQAADSEVLLASPYFVPGEHGLAVMSERVARGVHIEVVTNSLATTDEPLVHFGYARSRGALLKIGVALRELMPNAEPNPENIPALSGSLGRLHAKLAIVDSRWLFIGSMNMDQRSSRTNTEVGLVIDSPELAHEAAEILRHDRLPASYRLRLAEGGQRIEWVAGSEAAPTVLKREPGGATGPLFAQRLVSFMVGEEML